MPSTSEPLLLTMEEAAERLRIGRSKMYELVSAGEVDTVLVGRGSRRVPLTCLAEYVARLVARQVEHHEAA